MFDNVIRRLKDSIGDISAKRGDLRYMELTQQRFIDEAKSVQKMSENFANAVEKTTKLKRRQSSIFECDGIKLQQKDLETSYMELKFQYDNIFNKLSGANECFKYFCDNSDNLESWLKNAEERIITISEEYHDPQRHLERVKSMNAEIVAHNRQVDDLKKAGKILGESLKEIDVDLNSLNSIENRVDNIESRYKTLTNYVNNAAHDIQTKLVAAQEVSQTLDDLAAWIRNTNTMIGMMRGCSLNDESLILQKQDCQSLKADIKAHKPAVESIKRNASSERAENLCDKYDDITKKIAAREDNLNQISVKLDELAEMIREHESWLNNTTDQLTARETQKDPRIFKQYLDKISFEKEQRIENLELIKDKAEHLTLNPNLMDNHYIKSKLQSTEKLWHTFCELLTEKNRSTKNRIDKQDEYFQLRDLTELWLKDMEEKVQSLGPVAIDMDKLTLQVDAIQPLLKDHTEFANNMDKLYEIGLVHNSLENNDSFPLLRPKRKFLSNWVW